MSESYAELLERLEAMKRTLHNALEFITDDRIVAKLQTQGNSAFVRCSQKTIPSE
jgi:hypothetical protein